MSPGHFPDDVKGLFQPKPLYYHINRNKLAAQVRCFFHTENVGYFFSENGFNSNFSINIILSCELLKFSSQNIARVLQKFRKW